MSTSTSIWRLMRKPITKWSINYNDNSQANSFSTSPKVIRDLKREQNEVEGIVRVFHVEGVKDLLLMLLTLITMFPMFFSIAKSLVKRGRLGSLLKTMLATSDKSTSNRTIDCMF